MSAICPPLATLVRLFTLLLVSCGIASAAGLEISISPDGSATVPAGETKLINVTYNWPSLTNTLSGAKIEVPVPAGYDQNAPAITLLSSVHVASTSYNATTKIITYNMVDPLPAGSSGTFQIGLRFPNGTTPNNTTIPVVATSTATGQPANTDTTSLTATATDKAQIDKIVGAAPALDEKVTYLIRVKNNQGSGNYDLNSTTVVDTLPAGAQYISSSPTGTYNAGANTVTWNLGTVNAQTDTTLRVVVKFPSTSFSLTQIVNNNVNLSATLPNSQPATRTATLPATISPPNPSAGTQKWVSDNISSLNAYLTYYMSVANTGNVELSNYILTDDFPVEFIPVNLYIGSDNNGAETASVAVQYKTTANPSYVTAPGSPFTAVPGSDISIPVSSLGIGSATVTGIRYTYATLPVGYDTAWRSRADGTVGKPSTGVDRNGTAITPFPRNITNIANYAYTFNGNTATGSDPADTQIIAPTPKPKVTKSISGSSFQPTDGIHFYSEVQNGNGSQPLTDPVWADLLPAEVDYVPGSLAVGNAFAPFVPANLTVTPNYNGTGRTLLRYAATGVSLAPFTNGSIEFDVKVKAGTVVGSYSNTAYILSTTSPAVNPENTNPTPDTNDLDGDTNTTETIFSSDPTPFNVIRYAAMDSYKSVKGDLDSSFHRFPTNGLTNPSGNFVYKLTISNPGNVALKNIKLMDILPYVGDIGVKVTSATRDSEWTPYLTSAVTAPAGVTVSYSTSRNPVRSELDATLGDPTSGAAGTFSTTVPSNLTTVGSLLFNFGSIVLNPLQSLELTWTMTAPPSVVPGEIAWNSFAFRADASDDGQAPPPTEPIKVGVTVPAAAVAKIGDHAWYDADGNGIFDSGELPVTGLLVSLCDSSGNPVLDVGGNPVTTTTDSNGDYLFSVPPGTYSVKFASPAGYGPTIKDSTASGATDANDSDINSAGKTGNVTVAAGGENLTLDAGFANFANLGNKVFHDRNNDGMRDLLNDEGISGVVLTLCDGAGNPVDDPNQSGTQTYTLTTDPNGDYLFVNLLPGMYQVKIATAPASYPLSSVPTNGTDSNIEDDDNGAQATIGGATTSPKVTLTAGETDTTVDFGFLAPAHLGNLVWYDVNNNGIVDGTDSPVLNAVTVQLFKSGQNPASSAPFMTTTTSGGIYGFDVPP
jgi:uncharacterized repeat protein (TIGR01451 family)